MYVFELRVVQSKNLEAVEVDKNGEVINVIDPPVVVCQKCKHKNELHINDLNAHINEFQFASLLRVLKVRHRELHEKLNNYYDKVSNTIDPYK